MTKSKYVGDAQLEGIRRVEYQRDQMAGGRLKVLAKSYPRASPRPTFMNDTDHIQKLCAEATRANAGK